MKVKERCLPAGWYPSTEREVRDQLALWDGEAVGRGGSSPYGAFTQGASACVAPHAGWDFSGALAWLAWKAAAEADTVVVIGGHRPAGSAFIVAADEAYDSPLGPIRADLELGEHLSGLLDAQDERWEDNTVEVHLPMLAARFPAAKALWARAPNGPEAARLGLELAAWAGQRGKKLFVMASTDLTHYGPNYGWEPAGPGEEGRAWAAESDGLMATAFAELDAVKALRLAQERRAACSVGAALAAMAYAGALSDGKAAGRLLGLSSSWNRAKGPSFVGYCAVAYR